MINANTILLVLCILIRGNLYAQKGNVLHNDTIKIGLLINNENDVSARNGAQIAIDLANKNPNHLHLQLVIKAMDGPWNKGSQEVVTMIFKDKVWAILGSQDGRSSHLVEQAITKTRIVYLSAWASDPTLSKAFVPWYFSCVPNDDQQAEVLVKEIYDNRKINKLALIWNKGYDSQRALESLLKKVKISGKSEPTKLLYDGTTDNFKYLVEKIKNDGIQGLILLCDPSVSRVFLQQLRKVELKTPLFGMLSLLGEDTFHNVKLNNPIAVVSYENSLGDIKMSFQKQYQKKYEKLPDPVSIYAFDGMNLIIKAIKNSGFDQEKINDALSKIIYKGATGTIQFDKYGKRLSTPKLFRFENGNLVRSAN